MKATAEIELRGEARQVNGSVSAGGRVHTPLYLPLHELEAKEGDTLKVEVSVVKRPRGRAGGPGRTR